jgi:hypothetical protein
LLLLSLILLLLFLLTSLYNIFTLSFITSIGTVRSCLKELELEASGELIELEPSDSSSSEEDDDDDVGGDGTKKTLNDDSKKERKKKKKRKKHSFKQTTSIAKQKEAHQKRVNALKCAQCEHELLVNFVRLVDSYEGTV